jgi:hypothetical protein
METKRRMRMRMRMRMLVGSGVIRRHQASSDAIRRHQTPSGVIRFVWTSALETGRVEIPGSRPMRGIGQQQSSACSLMPSLYGIWAEGASA